MDRILREHWGSTVDAGGSIYGNCTAYKILVQDQLSFLNDFE